MSSQERSIAVAGAGAWGTALAVQLARRGLSVRLWVRRAELERQIASSRENERYLPGVVIPDAVTPLSALAEAVAGVELVVAAVPSQHARSVYRRMAPLLRARIPLVVAAKGVEELTLALPLEVASAELGRDRPMAILSGPSFAREVVEGRPTALVVATEWPDLAESVQQTLSFQTLRLYTSRDPTGVQVAGAVKNIIAIAAGMAGGLELGANGAAALITRGLAEMARLGQALGGRPGTFMGLAGLGDLVLTCTGDLSRNRQLGQRLGRGERLHDILSDSVSIVEGVPTARSVRELARTAGVEMPIVEQVYRILFEGDAPRQALDRLLGRPLTCEEV